MRNVFTISAIAGMLLLLVAAAPAAADWNPGDGHKMHYPQLPDPNGWDVSWWTEVWVPDPAPGHFEDRVVFLADDWRCSASGPVNDIHFWFSSQGDQQFQIDSVHAAIYENVAEGQIPPGGTDPAEFSQPGNRLWWDDFFPGEFAYRPYGTGDQGWFDPVEPYWELPDHTEFYQLNIEEIVDPFHQTEGEIYWLELHVNAVDPANPEERVYLGWKTSVDHFEDDGVFDWDYQAQQSDYVWHPLVDPYTGLTLDLAFVITPEPSSFVLAALGFSLLGVFGYLHRHRRRKP